ncbi:MAG TPA: hypothetical protein VFE93_07985, partial [Myxococcaceae bacterium]|nr:hypothetical protein [Myxococcaceae bacterium]
MPRPSPRRPRTTRRPRASFAEVTAILQASLGDRLHSFGLAADMSVVRGGVAIPPWPAALRKAFPHARRRIAVFVHGLGVTETIWNYPGRPRTSYGALLERDAAFTPVFLRYNTGRPVR